jgi:GxxExxY protein
MNGPTARVEPGARVEGLVHQVIGAAIEVHRVLGPGFLEAVYQDALAVETRLRGIPFEPQKPIDVCYKGEHVGQDRLDFLVDSALVVELKAVEQLAGIHTAQVLSYLKATKLPLGLLINFNTHILKDDIRRVVLS